MADNKSGTFNENGFYKIYKNEGLEAFLKYLGIPEDEIAGTVNDFVVEWEAWDTGYKMVEGFGNKEENIRRTGAPFDKEIDYEKCNTDASRYITSRISDGKYKSVIIDPDGTTTTWHWVYSADGFLTQSMEHSKTGLTCKLYLKKFTP